MEIEEMIIALGNIYPETDNVPSHVHLPVETAKAIALKLHALESRLAGYPASDEYDRLKRIETAAICTSNNAICQMHVAQSDLDEYGETPERLRELDSAKVASFDMWGIREALGLDMHGAPKADSLRPASQVEGEG